MLYLIYVAIGLLAGIVGGGLGLGGGAIMVPAMVMFLGLTQIQAQGTALAVMLPPVMILAVMKYYQNGNVNIQAAIVIAIAFTIGAFLGAGWAQVLPQALLKRGFGVFLIFIGIKMVFFK